ncbi:MAG: hypothetical protein CMM49_05390 [Rhodospirillaceae bacterium]|nr:hypothetical protein [Rhodospirillaceae bacterium]
MLNNLTKIPNLFRFILRHWQFLKVQNVMYTKEILIIISLGVITVIFEALGLSLIIPIFSYLESGGDLEVFKKDSFLSRYIYEVFRSLGINFNLFNLSLIAFVMATLRQLSNYVNRVENEKLKWRVDRRLQVKTFNLIINSSTHYIQDFRAGHLSNITAYEIPQVAAILRIYNGLTVVVLTGLAYATLLFITSPYITMFIGIFLSLLLILSSGFIRKTKKISEFNLEHRNKYRDFINERFFSWKLIRLFNNQKYEEDNVSSIQNNIFKNEIRLNKISAIISLFFVLSTTFLLLVAVNIFSELNLKLTIILTFGIAFSRLMPLMNNFQAYINNLIRYFPSCVYLEKVFIEAKKNYESLNTGHEMKSLKKDITFNQVYFKYPSRNITVLDNINFQLRAGNFIAIVGDSGAGKSTLVDMLTRLIVPSKGKIYFDGHDINKFSLNSIRNNIAYIPQEPVLFRMTIGENLRYAKLNATEEELWKALELANAYEFVNNLPDKLETNLGNMGSKLSGGQRQRIILARIFLKKPSLLILEEPTSALDKNSDQYINNSIANIKKNMNTTIILISHKITSYENIDTIIKINKGKIEKITYK